GPFTLTNAANDVTTLAANTGGAVSYRDATGLSVGTVNTVGVTTAGSNVTLQTGAALSIDQPVAIGLGNLTLNARAPATQIPQITAAGLELLGAGPFTLTNPLNEISTIAASTTGAVSYRDASDLAVGTVGSTSGVTTTGADTTLRTGATLAIGQPVALGAG